MDRRNESAFLAMWDSRLYCSWSPELTKGKTNSEPQDWHLFPRSHRPCRVPSPAVVSIHGKYQRLTEVEQKGLVHFRRLSIRRPDSFRNEFPGDDIVEGPQLEGLSQWNHRLNQIYFSRLCGSDSSEIRPHFEPLKGKSGWQEVWRWNSGQKGDVSDQK